MMSWMMSWMGKNLTDAREIWQDLLAIGGLGSPWVVMETGCSVVGGKCVRVRTSTCWPSDCDSPHAAGTSGSPSILDCPENKHVMWPSVIAWWLDVRLPVDAIRHNVNTRCHMITDYHWSLADDGSVRTAVCYRVSDWLVLPADCSKVDGGKPADRDTLKPREGPPRPAE